VSTAFGASSTPAPPRVSKRMSAPSTYTLPRPVASPRISVFVVGVIPMSMLDNRTPGISTSA